MITIKLQKHSSNKKIFYSIIIISNTLKPSSGKFIEKIGYYNPSIDNWFNKSVYVDFNRLFFWIRRGVKINKSLYLLIKPILLHNLKK